MTFFWPKQNKKISKPSLKKRFLAKKKKGMYHFCLFCFGKTLWQKLFWQKFCLKPSKVNKVLDLLLDFFFFGQNKTKNIKALFKKTFLTKKRHVPFLFWQNTLLSFFLESWTCSLDFQVQKVVFFFAKNKANKSPSHFCFGSLPGFTATAERRAFLDPNLFAFLTCLLK